MASVVGRGNARRGDHPMVGIGNFHEVHRTESEGVTRIEIIRPSASLVGWASWAHVQYVSDELLGVRAFAALLGIDVRPEYQGKGLGSELLEQVCLLLDSEGWECWLSPAPSGRLTIDDLMRWYARYGWTLQKDEQTMIRWPNRRAHA